MVRQRAGAHAAASSHEGTPHTTPTSNQQPATSRHHRPRRLVRVKRRHGCRPARQSICCVPTAPDVAAGHAVEAHVRHHGRLGVKEGTAANRTVRASIPSRCTQFAFVDCFVSDYLSAPTEAERARGGNAATRRRVSSLRAGSAWTRVFFWTTAPATGLLHVPSYGQTTFVLPRQGLAWPWPQRSAPEVPPKAYPHRAMDMR